MKRELAFALEVQSQLGESLGRTRGKSHGESKESNLVDEASQNASSKSKRFKGSVVNGVIVYTRGKKPRINSFSENEKSRKLAIEQAQTLTQVKKPKIGAEKSPAEVGGHNGALVVISEKGEMENDVPEKPFKRFTRRSLVPEVRPPSSLNASEMKTSKSSSLIKRPVTVKKLFDTGLLEGVPVIYMGVQKACDYGLRGTIKDGGILCTCSSCDGRRVIPPSKFEIHACRQYKRAAQYICFENGKSLLDLLNKCRESPLHKLEATIQSVINSTPEAQSFTCRKCKGEFPSSFVGQNEPLCDSCVNSKVLESPPTLSSLHTLEATIQSVISSTPEAQSFTCIKCKGNFPSAFVGQNEPLCDSCVKSTVLESPPTATTPLTPALSKRVRSAEVILPSKSPTTAPVRSASQCKSKWMLRTKSSKRVLVSKSSKSAPVHILQQTKSPGKIKKKLSKRVLKSKSSKSATRHVSFPTKIQWKITRKDQRLHKLVFEKCGLPDGTEVAYFARGQKLLQGYKKGSGIFCYCCNCVVSPSQFEVHAGWSSRKKPYEYIYMSNGVSLHELAVSLSKGRRYSARDNDDLCIICLDGGNLLLCDGCPRAFHKECASLSSIPKGDWYCKFCQNMFQREKFVEYNENAVAAGRVSGVDPIEEITRRCIRIVKNIETELSGCVLCRACDFSKSGFGPRTIILCDQCEKEFHIGCLKDHKMAFLKELPTGKWFCSKDCTRIHSALQKLLISGAEKLPESHLNVINKKLEVKQLEIDSNIDIRWSLISGKIASPETRSLLSEVVAIFHDCFDPIVDATSGRDLIPAMVYGRDVGGQEFGGMYCAILSINSSVVSAAMLRVFGQEIAELPLVATSNGNHGKGYFQILFSCIEKLLSFLNVKSIVLPAAEEAESIWTDKFGFTKIKPDQLSNYRRNCCQMLTFKGTSMLQKIVPPCRVLHGEL